MVHELPCCASSEIGRLSAPGWIDWTPELPRTSSWLPWRTSWHASHGSYYRAEKTIDHYRASQQRERAGLVTAPINGLKLTHRSLHRNGKGERTVTTARLQPDPDNGLQRPTCKDIRRIKPQDGPDLILSGSSTLTSTLLEHGLADEVLLVVYPVLLGMGTIATCMRLRIVGTTRLVSNCER
jgi:hypothetical protein